MSKRARISDTELKRRLETLKAAGLNVCRVIFSTSGDAEVIVNSAGIAPAVEDDEAEAAYREWAERSTQGKKAPR